MVIAILIVVGLCLGSFVNALTWRLREQDAETAKKKPDKKYLKQLAIGTGKSMCPQCRHQLSAQDLIPVLSWLTLGGRCRYCGKPISPQYPLIELAVAGLFVASYLWWPMAISGAGTAVFIAWLALLVGLVALAVYDLHWFLLPNRLMYPAGAIAVVMTVIAVVSATHPATTLLNAVLGLIVGGGVFYVLFQVSKGKWIGGGDVKLGWLLGLTVATPGKAVLFIFFGSILGTLVSLPLLYSGRMDRRSTIPFGPFLIIGAITTVLFGSSILHWYTHTFLNL